MHGRWLSTVEKIIAIRSPNSEKPLSVLRSWADERGLELAEVPVGDDIDEVYEPNVETLGITLGGDGTFLEGVRAFSPKGIPIMGVTTGRLAFLARVTPGELGDALDEVVRGEATVESRQQLRIRANGVDETGINELQLTNRPPDEPVDRKITTLRVFTDGEYVGEYEGTGIAVATPTGSTGVSLSAGGPIHHPTDNSTLQITPLQTHRMGVRPVVVDADTDIRIAVDAETRLIVDGGRTRTDLGVDQTVAVTGAETPAHVITTNYDDSFFAAVAGKLGWSIRTSGETPELPARHDSGRGADIDLLTRTQRVAKDAAREAGAILRDRHGHIESVEIKSSKADIVTDADYKSENVITTAIENEFPHHGIQSEESVEKAGSAPYTWMVDPLDGTGNFAHGNPNYAISIGLLENDEPVAGVVYVPETDEMFSATTDGPATLDGSRITTTDRETLDESMLLSGYDPDGTFLTHYYEEARGVRRLGSTALHLCFVAAGSADATWEHDTYPWDVAAGIVIARAAGATLTDSAGNPYTLTLDAADERTELLGSNGPLHATVLDHLSSHSQLHGAKRAQPASYSGSDR